MKKHGLDKYPYEPHETKRYQINPDQESRNRIQFLKTELYQPLEKLLGKGVVGVTGWGSLVKGKDLSNPEVAGKSDIDFGIYYDLKYVMDHLPELIKKDPSVASAFQEQIEELANGSFSKTEQRWVKTWQTEHQTEPLSNFYLHRFSADKQAAWAGILEGIQTQSMSVLTKTIGEVVLHECVEPFRDQAENRNIRLDWALMPYAYELMIRDILLARYRSASNNDSIDAVKFFSIDVGGGMRTMRKDFFNHLKDDPKREKKWQQIRMVIVNQEREGYLPEPIQQRYPMKFSDAYHQYTSHRLVE